MHRTHTHKEYGEIISIQLSMIFSEKDIRMLIDWVVSWIIWAFWTSVGTEAAFLWVFFTEDVLKNFAQFTGKHQCRSFFLNKSAGLRPATSKINSGADVLQWTLRNFKSICFVEHLRVIKAIFFNLNFFLPLSV